MSAVGAEQDYFPSIGITVKTIILLLITIYIFYHIRPNQENHHNGVGINIGTTTCDTCQRSHKLSIITIKNLK